MRQHDEEYNISQNETNIASFRKYVVHEMKMTPFDYTFEYYLLTVASSRMLGT